MYGFTTVFLRNKAFKYLFITISVLLLSGCASTVRQYGETKKSEPGYNGRQEPSRGDEESEVLFTSEGTASYYSDDFHGKKTANGETYDMNGISAAHPDFPLETIVRITNLKNQRSVILRINDRMPDFKGRMIDLSLGAARELGMVGEGIARVRLEVLKWGTGKKKK